MTKIGRKLGYICASMVALALTTAPTLACTPIKGEKYDDFSASNVSIAIATVVSKSAFATDGSSACLGVEYKTTDLLFGKLSENFEVENCYDNVPVDELRESEGLLALGFETGASVLVGVMPNDQTAVGLRYMMPSCWGPLHVRLDTLESGERQDVLDEFQAGLLKYQSPESKDK